MNKDCFVTWVEGDEEGKKKALIEVSKAYDKSSKLMHKTRAASDAFRRITEPNVSIRDGFERYDYDYFRPEESLPTRDKDVIAACMQAYKRFGIVKNIVDLMSDFAVKGIDIVHPKLKVEKFGKEWFKRVNGPERSERMLNMLFKAGNLVVKRGTAKLPDKTMDVLRTSKAADVKINTKVKLPEGEIPISYSILDPRTLDVLSAELAPFIGKKAYRYAVNIPQILLQKIKRPNLSYESDLIDEIPTEFRPIGKKIVIPENKTITGFYKKDDFEIWATPMLYPILDHLKLYNKLILADRAALDGAISNVRLWTLGSLDHKMYPTEGAIERVSEMLLNNVGGGVIDLIWGPDLTLTESKSEVYKFLGEEKYRPTLQAIFQGLGVPPTLTGVQTDAGFTNNFVSLKILTERLEYGRMIIAKIWEQELDILREIFGFKEPFQIVFDDMSLSDEAAGLKLLIDLADKNYISLEYLQERFGAVPEIEKVRMLRESKLRDKGLLPPKTQADNKDNLLRSFVTQGLVTPSEVGIKLKEKDKKQKSLVEIKIEEASKKAQKLAETSTNKGGRPSGTKDVIKRKTKRVTPRTGFSKGVAESLLWATKAQSDIENLVRDGYLNSKKKKNLRTLTAKEMEEYEQFKFVILCKLDLGDVVNKDKVVGILKQPLSLPANVNELYKVTLAKCVEKDGKELSVEKVRQIQAAVYALYKAELAMENEYGENEY